MHAAKRYLFAWVAVLVGFATSGLYLSAAHAAEARADAARALTRSVLQLADELSRAPASQNVAAQERLAAAVAARQAAMRQVLANDSALFSQLALTGEQRARLPIAQRRSVETRMVLDGTLQAIYVDSADRAYLFHFLVTPEKRLRLHFPRAPARLRSGVAVRVSGIALDDQFAVDSGTDGLRLLASGDELAVAESGSAALSTTAETLAPVSGVQRTIVLLANFSDDTSQPWTLETARRVVFGTVSDYLAENSLHTVSLQGEVAGWFTLPLSRANCSLSSAGHAADRAAALAGIDLSRYERIVYLFTRTACSVDGMGTIGDRPSRAYINGLPPDHLEAAETIAHELGHNFGLYHAHALDCGAVAIASQCNSLIYGDTYDVMGNPDFGHFNAFHKERLGWAGEGLAAAGIEARAGGRYRLTPFAAPSAGTKFIKIPRGPDPVTGVPSWFYVEYRQAIGFDAFLTRRSGVIGRGDVTQGLVVRLARPGDADSSYLLHMNLNPSTYAVSGIDWFDPALEVGATYRDPATGIELTTEAADASGATLRVSFGVASCVRGVPTISASPNRSAAVAPGAPVEYVIDVRNSDNAACGASSFSLAAAGPAGFTTGLRATVLSIGAGEAASTVLNSVSSPTVADGEYALRVTATREADPGSSVSAQFTHVVQTASVNAPPVAMADTAVTNTNTAVRVPVLGNDYDPEGRALTVIATSPASKGDLTINSDGSVTYRPASRASGDDSFSYTISDGVSTATAAVRVQIQKPRRRN